MKQEISLVNLRHGTFIGDSLKGIQWADGNQLVVRCEQKLIRLEASVHSLEALMYSDWDLKLEQVVAQARIKKMHEREAFQKSLSEKEALIADLQERQRHLQVEMDASASIIARLKDKVTEEESTQEEFHLERANVRDAAQRERQALQVLQQEMAAANAPIEAKIWKEAEEQVRVERVKRLAIVKAQLTSFSLTGFAGHED